ncbi:hypothetical protein RI543_003609 [Arxiozyma heterogenica]|uniref:Uncharacterized protein n=1 Tax=Arxiozyma heterogenica TaxID=278026 RepID=A0AAN7WIR7_9SACH|nr:hypothetical protein RI543_003609 [Kazachstania heterogenica]
MTLSVANIRVGSNSILPIRIFINRKQLANNIPSNTVFETPLLSSSTLVSLKSPKTRIYISNNDMKNLCDELKDDLLLILYELTSPMIYNTVLQKTRIGRTLDFQQNIVKRIIGSYDENSDDHGRGEFLKSHILTIKKLSKVKYKLHFKFNWEVEIYINSISKLSKIRQNLIFKNYPNNLDVYDRRASLLIDKSTIVIPEEEVMPNIDNNSILSQSKEVNVDVKPEIIFKYKPIATFVPCIDIHILQRPRRKH